MFVHHVFFWLKPELTETEKQKFEAGVLSLLQIETIKVGDVGKPANTNRPVIDRSYDYSLLTVFETEKDHDSYQSAPIHLKFIEECARYWAKVVVYDSETI